MPDARVAVARDLASLLALFDASDVSRYAEPKQRAERVWSHCSESSTIRVAA